MSREHVHTYQKSFAYNNNKRNKVLVFKTIECQTVDQIAENQRKKKNLMNIHRDFMLKIYESDSKIGEYEKKPTVWL